MENNFRWIFIPRDIWLDKKLNLIQKILLIEIDSFIQSNWKCIETNKYFAKFYWVTTTHISKSINELAKLWYINIELIYAENSKQIIERKITR